MFGRHGAQRLPLRGAVGAGIVAGRATLLVHRLGAGQFAPLLRREKRYQREQKHEGDSHDARNLSQFGGNEKAAKIYFPTKISNVSKISNDGY
jgi:hypothetical protein